MAAASDRKHSAASIFTICKVMTFKITIPKIMIHKTTIHKLKFCLNTLLCISKVVLLDEGWKKLNNFFLCILTQFFYHLACNHVQLHGWKNTNAYAWLQHACTCNLRKDSHIFWRHTFTCLHTFSNVGNIDPRNLAMSNFCHKWADNHFRYLFFKRLQSIGRISLDVLNDHLSAFCLEIFNRHFSECK